MAWIFLLNGYDYKSIVDSSMIDKIDVLLEDIDNIKEYQELKKISTDKKLLFNIKLNAYENVEVQFILRPLHKNFAPRTPLTLILFC